MTLVEVVVAMSIFSIMTLGITMAFAACIKYNARNVRRDFELNTQQTALEKGNEGGVQVYNDTFNNKQTLEFKRIDAGGAAGATVQSDMNWTAAGSSSVYSGLVEYNAQKTALNENDINFRLKTFSSQNLGSSRTVADPNNDMYVIKLNNLNPNDIDVRIEMNNGTCAYVGNFNSTGYVNRAPMYSVSLSGYDPTATLPVNEYDDDGNLIVDGAGNPITSSSVPSNMTVGPKFDSHDLDPTADPYVTIKIIQNGAIQTSWNLYRSHISNATGIITYEYRDDFIAHEVYN